MHWTMSSSFFFFFFLMIRRPPRSTLFPTRRSSDLQRRGAALRGLGKDDARRDGGGLVGRWCSRLDRKSTRLNSSHSQISYAVFCLKKKRQHSAPRCRLCV